MNKKLTIAMLATFCLTTLLMIPLTHSTEPYDPWVDVTGPTPGVEDGTINMRDIQYEILHFNTFGDTTKNVSVVNWPIAEQQTVFYNVTESTVGSYYSAKGFSHIHLTWYMTGLVDPETVTIRIWAYMSNPAGGGGIGFWPSTIGVTSDNAKGTQKIPVPSASFAFSVYYAVGTTASVYLSYYLTYA